MGTCVISNCYDNRQYNYILADASRLQTVQVQHEATIMHLQSELEAAKLKCSQLKQGHGETQVNPVIHSQIMQA